jgi:hypothetical protein
MKPEDPQAGGLMGDLASKRWIVIKGLMFALIVVLAAVGELLYNDLWLRLPLLVVCLWAACRFYYFLFYVLERYVGVEGRYAGIWDLTVRLWRRSRR